MRCTLFFSFKLTQRAYQQSPCCRFIQNSDCTSHQGKKITIIPLDKLGYIPRYHSHRINHLNIKNGEKPCEKIFVLISFSDNSNIISLFKHLCSCQTWTNQHKRFFWCYFWHGKRIYNIKKRHSLWKNTCKNNFFRKEGLWNLYNFQFARKVN